MLEPYAPSHSEHPQQRRTRQRPARRSSLAGWLVVVLALVLLVLLGGVLALLVGERLYSGYIYPHISVRGVDVSYQDSAAARDSLEHHFSTYLHQPVELVYNDQVWHPTAVDLGLRLDLDTTLGTALALGRADTEIESARMVADIWAEGVDVPLSASVDQQTLQHYLLDIAQEIERPARNASVGLDGADVVVVSEENGVQVLADETLAEITAALQQFEQRRIHVRTRTLEPTVHDTDIAGVIFGAHTMLDGPITLSSNAVQCEPACRWEWPPELISSWLHLESTPGENGRPVYSLSVDQSALQRALIPIANMLRRDGTLPRVDWNGGNMAIMLPGTSGRGLDAALALERINQALQGGERHIELPITDIPPPVVDSNLASLGISEVVGIGVSSFRASQPYRITNIQAGARRMNGILIPPGGSFSFNGSLGPVNGANGFVQGSAIVDNRTQQEWGGGLCQVSTTMFRAAFWAGLPITERHEHTFRIGWYEELGEPPGLDATIFTGVNDLRFVNDTGGWLLTQALVDTYNQKLTIILYGQPTTRQVSMSHAILSRTPALRKPLYIDDPSLPAGYVKQTDWAQPGMHVQVYRTVWEGGQVARQDTFNTVFEPWPNIFVRGTGGR
jgi:vancomycin resistance protein YoaR